MCPPTAEVGLIAIIVWAVVVLARRERGGDAPRHPRETPQQRLDRRLAEGDIDLETYDEVHGRLREPTDRLEPADHQETPA